MTQEIIALTEELQATRRMLSIVVARLDEADQRARRHRIGIVLVAICLAAVVVLGAVFYVNEHRNDEQACRDRRDARLVLRELVELSDDDRGGFNLTAIESFSDLDPATQQYLRDLEAASREAPNPSRFVDNALALLDVPDCD